jgi:hypothetical protein
MRLMPGRTPAFGSTLHRGGSVTTHRAGHHSDRTAWRDPRLDDKIADQLHQHPDNSGLPISSWSILD